MKMPEPIGVVAESRKTISTAFNTTIYTRERFHQGAKVYDKQALIDLLEAAAAVALRDIDALHNAGLVDVTVEALRSMKEKL